MKYLVWVIVLFAAAVAVSTAAHNPGYVLLVYPPKLIELSLTLFVASLILSFVFGYGLVRLVIAVLQLPTYVKKFRMERSHAKSRELLDEELVAFFEGRYAAAEKAAARAMELGDTSVLHPVIAARSAHELRANKRRDAYLSAAENQSAGDTMRLMTSAKFMLDQRNPRSALNVLQKLRDQGKDHVGALSLELKAHQQLGNWDEVLNLLDKLERRSAIDTTLAEQSRQLAWLEKIRQQENLAGLTACLKNIPSEFKRRGKVAATAARALIQHGGGTLAQQILTDSLNAQWDSELVALYGDCLTGDHPFNQGAAQIEQAEKWLNQHQEDSGLLLALGKLCLHQKLWGKAKNYLDASISLSPSLAAYTAQALLAERLGKADEALKYHQQALELGKP